MTQENWQEFCELMNITSEITVGKEKNEKILAFEFKLLEPYEFTDIYKSVMYLIKKNKFCPTISDIISMIDGSLDSRGREAWQIVIKTVKDCGTYNSVIFGDPKIHYAIQKIGGWQAIGLIKDNEMPFKEKEFCEYYKEADQKGIMGENVNIPVKLIGIHEATNTIEGLNNGKETIYIDCGKANQRKLLT